MDLLSIFQTLWRYKLFAIPTIVITAVAALYVVKIKPPVYQTSASILLTNPQTGATQSQIAANPSLKKANPYNTFVSYGDLHVVGNAVMDLVTSPASQPGLASAGVDPRYQVALSTDYGNPPIINITGVGATAQDAMRSATVLVSTMKADLFYIQKMEGVNPFYMITAIEIVKPTQADRSSGGKLRSLIAVLAVGAILLFVVVSVADAIEKRRREARLDNADTIGKRRPTGRLGNNARRTDFRRTPRIDDGPLGGESDFVNGSAVKRAAGNVDAQARTREHPTARGYPQG